MKCTLFIFFLFSFLFSNQEQRSLIRLLATSLDYSFVLVTILIKPITFKFVPLRMGIAIFLTFKLRHDFVVDKFESSEKDTAVQLRLNSLYM